MQFAIIISKKDPAGLAIKGFLPKDLNVNLVEKETIYNENIDKQIKADFFIFATKHESKIKIPAFSVHCPGNWGKAEMGGNDFTLNRSSSLLQFKALRFLNENNPKYELILEATHHGPYLEKPCFFIEIGSSLKEWQDEEAANLVAKTILHVINSKTEKVNTAIGIGGLHHGPNFVKYSLRNNVAISHICPKYALEFLNKNMFNQTIQKTMETVNYVLIDWKGLGKEKDKIKELLKNTNLEIIKI